MISTDLTQRQLDRLLHRHGSSLYPERVELRFSEHPAQLRHKPVVFNMFLNHHRDIDFFAQGLRCTNQPGGALWLFVNNRKKGKTFELMCSGRTVAEILKGCNGFFINRLCPCKITCRVCDVTQFALQHSFKSPEAQLLEYF